MMSQTTVSVRMDEQLKKEFRTNKLYFRDCKTGIYWKGSKKTIYESTKFKHVYKNVRRRIRI